MSIQIIQISDIHLFADKDADLLGVKTEESFMAVRDCIIRNEHDADMVILSGDLSQDGSEASYKRLAEYVKSFNKPAYFFAGNHDFPENIDQYFTGSHIKPDKQILHDNWQIILLNSHKPGAVEGYLDSDQLKFMQDCLEAYPEYRSIVMFHHHPFGINCAWLDPLGVSNADIFWQRISKYKNVGAVFFGHIHQVIEKSHNGIKCYSPPSTCIQFKGGQDDFALENIPPGYRRIVLHDDGSIETEVKRLDKYIGHYDPDAAGY